MRSTWRATRVLVLVSGLPRSGTSLAMRLLEAGGIPARYDRHGPKDESNPHGYYEWGRYAEGEKFVDGTCVKAIGEAPVPPGIAVKALWCARDPEERAASWVTHVARMASKPRLVPAGPVPTHAETLARNATLEAFSREKIAAKGWPVLDVDYAGLVLAPQPWCEKIADFLAPEFTLDVAAMSKIPDPALYRNRKGGVS